MKRALLARLTRIRWYWSNRSATELLVTEPRHERDSKKLMTDANEAQDAAVLVLDQQLYSIGEAARLLAVAPRTLRNWLEGYRVRGVDYPPVIRPEPSGSDAVTWAEFIEAGLLREYRTRVPLRRLRPVIDVLRAEYRVPYPLAHYKPFVSGQDLIFRAQQDADVDREAWLVIKVDPPDRSGWVDERGHSAQYVWAKPVQLYLEKVDFEADVAVRFRPLGREVPVVIDPRVSFGIPTVHGFRTETLAEAYASGETYEEIAAAWRLETTDVEWAIRWELQRLDQANQIPA